MTNNKTNKTMLFMRGILFWIACIAALIIIFYVLPVNSYRLNSPYKLLQDSVSAHTNTKIKKINEVKTITNPDDNSYTTYELYVNDNYNSPIIVDVYKQPGTATTGRHPEYLSQLMTNMAKSENWSRSGARSVQSQIYKQQIKTTKDAYKFLPWWVALLMILVGGFLCIMMFSFIFTII